MILQPPTTYPTPTKKPNPNTSTIFLADVGKRDAETPSEEKALNFIKRAGIIDGPQITAAERVEERDGGTPPCAGMNLWCPSHSSKPNVRGPFFSCAMLGLCIY